MRGVCRQQAAGGTAALLRSSRPQRAACARRGAAAVRAAVTLPESYSKMEVRGSNILVKVADAEKETKGGVLLPTQAQTKPTSGDVVHLGSKTAQLEAGQTVLYSKFGIGCTDVVMSGQDYVILLEEDCIGVMPRSAAEIDDIPELVPMFDRVLIKIEEAVNVTSGGLVIPNAGKERPMCGEVVRTGPGKKNAEGELEALSVAPGDKVIYFKYAGDVMPTSSGARYTVVHASDILCKQA